MINTQLNQWLTRKCKPLAIKRNQGFSLLELLVVVSLLGLLALSATALVDNVDEQHRFDLTKSKLQQIRRAILGDSSRTLNGEPDISGYVADMGRLPNNIEELLKQGAQTAWAAYPIDVSAPDVGDLYGGWRGPYLEALPETTGVAFRDGWGNPDASGVDPNFGWNVTSTATGMSVKSYGSDGPTGTGTGVYEIDYPSTGNLIEENEWQVDVSGVKFNVVLNNAPTVTSPYLVLRLYFFENTGVDSEDSNEFLALSGVTTPYQVAITPSTSLPMGRYAAVVICTQGTPENLLDDTVYDGDCPGSSTKHPYYFTLLPRSFAPPITIPWNIP